MNSYAMNSSLLGRVKAFWIAALALLLSLSSNGQCVDAAIFDSHYYYRNRGYSASSNSKWKSPRHSELEYKPQRRRRQLPWLLPLHSIHNSNFETKTALLWKLRGGSNKSEVESNTTASTAETKKDKRRNDKSKKNANKKDKRKRKNKKQTVDEDETNESDADDDSPVENETTATAEEDEYASKLFLVDPFRMNEIARYEASIAQDSEEDKDAASDDAASESESDEIVEQQVVNNKQRNKKGKKKEDRKKTTTEEEESSMVAQEPEIVQEKKDNRKNKRNRKRNDRKQAEAEIKVEDDNTSPATIDSASETSEEEGETDAADASEHSSPFWFVDVWTQQLSDPEEMIEDLEETETPTESDSLAIATEDDAIDTIPNENDALQASRKRGKDKQSPAPIEEALETPPTPDSNTSSIDIVDENEANFTALSENETEAVLTLEQNTSSTTALETTPEAPKSYVSTGAWVLIDNMLTIGLASKFKPLRLSTKLRLIRKLSARVTRMHGLLSGKPSSTRLIATDETSTNLTATGENVTDSEEDLGVIQKRLAAIEQAREGVERAQAEERAKKGKRNFWGFRVRDDVADLYLDANETSAQADALSISESEDTEDVEEEPKIPPKTPEVIEAEFQRMERVREIDQLIVEGQNRLAELICEKDVLQRRPNPLFNYTTTETTVTVEEIEEDATAGNTTKSEKNATRKIEIQASRQMNFPPDDLVAEYLDMMISTRRLTKMNHTDLWQESEDEVQEEEEESIGDDLFTASANAHRLYQGSTPMNKNGNGVAKNGKKGGGGGSWLLRQRIGGPRSLGEKIGELVETLAYKAITASLMSFLARMISGLHGTNVLKHSDIRLFLESSPDLPPIPKDGIINGNHESYAEETLKTVMRRKTRRTTKRSQASFLQQEAVTETLLSHVQISAPLLKLFPLAWQRALLGNIIGLSCAIISDFMDGLHFQILGHQLSFAFRPITEVDMARHLEMAGGRFNQRRYKAAEFEAAIQATAEDLKEELKFLDSWHERALGSGVLRTQVANLIARIVLTLTDEVLSGARMDLWSTQAGGPRMLAGLEHRLEEDENEGEQL